MEPSKIDPAVYRLVAATPAYRRLKQRLRDDLARELDDTCYVSFSGGKDSTVLAHAAHLALPGIPILCSDSGVPFRWTADERDRFAACARERGWNYRTFTWDKWGQTRVTADAAKYRASVHASQFEELERWATAHGYTRRVMGLRAEESRKRRISLGTDRGSSKTRLCPIGLWKIDHVWAYLVEHGLPWVGIYDHQGPAARNGLIGLNAAENGRLVYLKHHYPEAYRVARMLFAADDLR